MYYQVRRAKDGSPKSFQFFMSFSDPVTNKNRVLSTTIKNPGKREKPSLKDKQYALQVLTRKKDEYVRESLSPSGTRATLHQIIAAYIDYQRSAGIRATTYERNERVLGYAERLFGADTIVDTLTPLYIHQKFCEGGDGPVTVNERLTRFRACLRWASQNELCRDIRIQLLPAPESHRQRVQDKYYSMADLKMLLPLIRLDGTYLWYLAAAFLLLTGLRVGEFIALRKEDVDIEGRVIHVNKTYVLNTSREAVSRINPPKTFDSFRDVYCQEELVCFIREDVVPYMELMEKQAGKTSELFFHGRGGGYIGYDAFRSAFRRYCERAGCPYKGIHALRHTHASILVMKGIPESCISHRLGHRTFAGGPGAAITSDIYLHVMPELECEWNEKLDAVRILNTDTTDTDTAD